VRLGLGASLVAAASIAYGTLDGPVRLGLGASLVAAAPIA
jgi:hypothetical protein